MAQTWYRDSEWTEYSKGETFRSSRTHVTQRGGTTESGPLHDSPAVASSGSSSTHYETFSRYAATAYSEFVYDGSNSTYLSASEAKSITTDDGPPATSNTKFTSTATDEEREHTYQVSRSSYSNSQSEASEYTYDDVAQGEVANPTTPPDSDWSSTDTVAPRLTATITCTYYLSITEADSSDFYTTICSSSTYTFESQTGPLPDDTTESETWRWNEAANSSEANVATTKSTFGGDDDTWEFAYEEDGGANPDQYATPNDRTEYLLPQGASWATDPAGNIPDFSLTANFECYDFVRREVLYWIKRGIAPAYAVGDRIIPEFSACGSVSTSISSGVWTDLIDSASGDTTITQELSWYEDIRRTMKVWSYSSSSYTIEEDGEEIVVVDESLNGVEWNSTAPKLTSTVNINTDLNWMTFEAGDPAESFISIEAQSSSWDTDESRVSFYDTSSTVPDQYISDSETYQTWNWSKAGVSSTNGWTSWENSQLFSSYISYVEDGENLFSLVGSFSTTSQSWGSSSTTVLWTSHKSGNKFSTKHPYMTVQASDDGAAGDADGNVATPPYTSSTWSGSSSSHGETISNTTESRILHTNALIQMTWNQYSDFHDQHTGGGGMREAPLEDGVGHAIGIRVWRDVLPFGFFGFEGGWESTDAVYSGVNTNLIDGLMHSAFSSIWLSDLAYVPMVTYNSKWSEEIKVWATNMDCIPVNDRLWVDQWEHVFESLAGSGETAATLLITFTDTTTTGTGTDTATTSWQASVGLSAAAEITDSFVQEYTSPPRVPAADHNDLHPLAIASFHTNYHVYDYWADNFEGASGTLTLQGGFAWTLASWTDGDSISDGGMTTTITDVFETFLVDDARAIGFTQEDLYVVYPDYRSTADYTVAPFYYVDSA